MSQMTDKEKIRQEIERRREKYRTSRDFIDAIRCTTCTEILSFIDSLPEEKKPIREYVSPEDSTLGKLYKEAMEELEEKIALYEKNHKKSVSNDLEEAAKIYTISLVINEIVPDATVKQLREVADKSFKAGAQWGKEQTEKQIKTQSMALPHGCPKEESVSKDLEEAASQYPSIICQISPQWTSEVENVFIAGAQWQKEQMMKEVVETTVSSMVHQLIVTDYIIVNAEQFGLKKGDKVKVLIIKE